MGERKLGLVAVTSLTLVSLVGTGMFFGPGISAKYGGPAAILAWLLLGINSIYVGMVFAELSAKMPTAGGVYAFARAAYGRFPSFMIGWTQWLVSTINTAVLLIAALDYAFPLLALTHKLLAAIFLLAILHVIAYKGLGATEALLTVFAFSLVGFVIITIITGIFHVQPHYYQPFFIGPPHLLFVALFFILETYFGWEAASFLAEETQDPETTLPRALLISSILSALLGLVFVIVLYGVVPATRLASTPAPLVEVFSLLFGAHGVLFLKIGVFVSLIGSAAGNIIAAPRLVLGMARDKLFIEQLAKISEKTGTPGNAIFFQFIISGIVLLAALGRYTLLLSIMVPMALVVYIATLLALPRLRKLQGKPKTYAAPFARSGPYLSCALFVAAFIGWLVVDPSASAVLKFLLSLLSFGVPIYLLLSTYYNPSTQLFFSDALAYPALWLETLIFPSRIRKRMLALFGNLEGKVILELGAGVGSLTMHLAEAVTPSGKVIAIEAGKNNVTLLTKRIRKKRHEHVSVIHDEHATTRVHPAVKRIDAMFSMGMLGYLQESDGVLKQLGSIMPEHAPVVFMEWVDYFGVIPDPAWLEDLPGIKTRFGKAGFAVRAELVKGLFWNYLLVYGVKTDRTDAFA